MGGPIDLTAPNGVGNALGAYSYLADAVHNPKGAGLQTGVVYNVWIDIENRPFDVSGGAQNGGDLYSLYLGREGGATRTNLFQGLLSDRDAIAIDPVLGAPLPTLTHLFFCVNNQTTPQGANTLLLDDLFLSANGFNSSIPVPASSFEPGFRQRRFASRLFPTTRAQPLSPLTWSSTPNVHCGKTDLAHRRNLNASCDAISGWRRHGPHSFVQRQNRQWCGVALPNFGPVSAAAALPY
jgi:hypothetical protein